MNAISLSFLDHRCKRGGLPFFKKKKTPFMNKVEFHVIAGGNLWGFRGIVLSGGQLAPANVPVLYPARVIQNFCVCRGGMAEISFHVSLVLQAS